MERFAVVAKDDDKRDELISTLEDHGFTRESDPEFVVSYGGDGTLLESEREYPGVPKIVARDSNVCYKCHDEPLEKVLEHVKQDAYTIEEMRKLAVRRRTALNDVIIRNSDPTQAIRFSVQAGAVATDTVIGDGVVIATPFGSTGYYFSITRNEFTEGIGVAFNNPTRPQESLHASWEETITIELERGVADLAVDNDPRIHEVEEGESIDVTASDQVARLITT